MSGPNDVDRLLREWEDVASTAKPPDPDPRRSVQGTGALPASMLLVAAVAIAVVAIVGRGAADPQVAATPRPSALAGGNGPVTGVAESGGFRLTLTADHAVYAEGQPIDAFAVVEYLGPDDADPVEHASSPVGFGVREVGGVRHVMPAYRTLSTTTIYVRGEPVTYSWAKSGGSDPLPASHDPNALFVSDYLRSDELVLPHGTWELFVEFPGMEATVAITVEPATAEASESPAPSATPFAADGSDQDDRFRLELTTDRASYAEGDAIDAIASVIFLGLEDDVVVSAGVLGPVWFSVMELGGAGRRAGFTDQYVGTLLPRCEEATYPRGTPVEYPWVKGGSSATAFDEAFWEEYLISVDTGADPVLQLPAGRWMLTARFGASESGCDREGPRHSLRADVIVEVTAPAPTEFPPPFGAGLSDRGVADDGRFRVKLTSNGIAFQEGETIGAGAEVTFLGPEDSVRTGHGSPPVTFVVEEVGGAGRSAGGGTDTVCLRSTWERNEAVAYPWQRGGSWSTDNPSPNDQFARTYVEGWSGARDGELRLPAGTWRLSATLDLNEGDCGPSNPRTASIVIHVDPAPGTATPAPEPPVVEVGPVVICDRVSPDDCEHAVAMVREHFDAGRDTYAGVDFVLVADTCPANADCDREFPFEATVVSAMVVLEADENGAKPGLAFFTGSAMLAQGTDGPERVIAATEADVPRWMQEPAYDAIDRVPVPTFPPQLPNEPRECPAALISGTLVEMPMYGMGLEVDGEAWPVRWPFGFSARRDEGELVLLDAAGDVIAGHGDAIQAGGGFGETHVLACGSVIRAPAEERP